MEWYRDVQFVSAVPMPEKMADEFGTTVNGMWNDADQVTAQTATDAHDAGRFALFSVPLIALVPDVYEAPDTAHLLDSICRDVHGNQAEATWYYWESKPVYSACIYSDTFRAHLRGLCARAVDLGTDVVNLDEIMCSTGLMNREPRGSGFCRLCLDRFRSGGGADDADVADLDDYALRAALAADDARYERYRRFHERETFRVMVGLVEELRAHARVRNPGFAISANVAYLGNKIRDYGALWSGIWGPHLEFVLMENDYRIEQHLPHVILPRGKFAAWYRLASTFRGAPTWICPSIHVPRQLAGEDRQRYYELMFVESYANGGRWGYFWGPGTDADARRRASAPDSIRDHIRFIDTHRRLYQTRETGNRLAILYLEGPVLSHGHAHEKYLALAQALYETGVQFDVVYAGDGDFNPESIGPERLEPYDAILVPEADGAGPAAVAALARRAAAGASVVVFSPSPLEPGVARHEDGSVLARFWTGYEDADRDRIAAVVADVTDDRIAVSHPSVVPVRYVADGRQVVHLVNYGYLPDGDRIQPVDDLEVRLPGLVTTAGGCRLLDQAGERPAAFRAGDDGLTVRIPHLDTYALLVVDP